MRGDTKACTYISVPTAKATARAAKYCNVSSRIIQPIRNESNNFAEDIWPRQDINPILAQVQHFRACLYLLLPVNAIVLKLQCEILCVLLCIMETVHSGNRQHNN
jgi:hypothetical protein